METPEWLGAIASAWSARQLTATCSSFPHASPRSLFPSTTPLSMDAPSVPSHPSSMGAVRGLNPASVTAFSRFIHHLPHFVSKTSISKNQIFSQFHSSTWSCSWYFNILGHTQRHTSAINNIHGFSTAPKGIRIGLDIQDSEHT
ncbi:hypothetical protein GUJ93_ZPchr0010g8468 [Zizania palustris]|uniref:Uncharacterized protein n=1 Tax=Zizania palustris TaxID=103762 RepID=A0A8J5THX1_ZIZPA|nr:hypothetical protein GUJ93_ZPchr0010g8468 [Zizania palustris]